MKIETKKFKSIDEFLSYLPSSQKNAIKIKIGMGSCGIAAGAGRIYNSFENEIQKRGIKNIILEKVGCLGLCFCEPNVEVIIEGLPDILYGKVNEKFALRIIEEHVGNKNIINENIYDKPFIDVWQIKEN